ncbi:MAG: FAD-binding protein [Candidatus Thermoplasmatota archaeon]|jgi:succinate dehydrogenase / fumarate reductase flavoprotein subunit|nr:FAD-binding protein [Candidatus Thermoplasmatota archaeon]MCL5667638.1 FAD-binding protein [Candidatus Thermoplasmatota archaeon]
MTEKYIDYETDILIIGAGGAGLRAAIAGFDSGVRVTVVTKSLLGKAHTVMAEGGIAASLGNLDNKDNWEVHFNDTVVEGVYISNWRMAELLAREAPDRVYELEHYGALFDRTPEGKISQRAFGAHTYRRLCHVGDRTGLELIKTLEDQVLHRDIKFFDELYITKLLKKGDRVIGAVGIKLNSGEFYAFRAKAVIVATGGCGKIYKVTSNSWESTGDGLGLAFNAGAELMDMEMIQFHPTGMVYPPGVRGLLVTEGVRGDGGILLNSEGERYMLRYSPKKKELDARDIVARANYAEIMAGRGTPHGGVYLDISHKGADYIKTKLPSMYAQFKDFAGVDITKEKMEVAPTVHYQMGGIKVDPDTTKTNVEGLFAAGEVASGLHGANRLGGNSLADILVFGRRSGLGAAEYTKKATLEDPSKSDIEAEIARVKSYMRDDGRNPYEIIEELSANMSDNVGIIRTETNLQKALIKILELKSSAPKVGVRGDLKYNKGLLACLEIPNMLTAAEAVVRGAMTRKESRGAHARSDYPKKDPNLKKNIIYKKSGDEMKLELRPVPEMPENLKKLVDPEEY